MTIFQGCRPGTADEPVDWVYLALGLRDCKDIREFKNYIQVSLDKKALYYGGSFGYCLDGQWLTSVHEGSVQYISFIRYFFRARRVLDFKHVGDYFVCKFKKTNNSPPINLILQKPKVSNYVQGK